MRRPPAPAASAPRHARAPAAGVGRLLTGVRALAAPVTSYEHPRVDVLRLKVGSNHEWKVLKNLVNTGVLGEIRQLSLHLRMEDRTMWDEYKTILNGVRAAGFHPYYSKKQTGASFLKVQEGTQQLFSSYEVSYGNVL